MDAGNGIDGSHPEYPPFNSLTDNFSAVDFETVDIVAPDKLDAAKGLDNGYSSAQVESLIARRGYKHTILVCPGGCKAAEVIAKAEFRKGKARSGA